MGTFPPSGSDAACGLGTVVRRRMHPEPVNDGDPNVAMVGSAEAAEPSGGSGGCQAAGGGWLWSVAVISGDRRQPERRLAGKAGT
jgi:hypothetical protein